MKSHFKMFAAYNRWANRLLLGSCRDLNADDYLKDLKAPHSSVNGTLNQMYVADVVWLHRFTGEGDAPYTIDDIPFDMLSDLSAARAVLDERIISFVDHLENDVIASTILYRTIRKPLVMEQPLSSALSHVFNSQSGFRGQVNLMLAQLGIDPETNDLIQFQRETGIGMTSDLVDGKFMDKPPASQHVACG